MYYGCRHVNDVMSVTTSNHKHRVIITLQTDFFDEQEAYVRQMIATSTDNPPFWTALGLIMNQYDGLALGYAATQQPGQNLTNFAFQLLNGDGTS